MKLTIIVDPDGFKWYYAETFDGKVYRWDKYARADFNVRREYKYQNKEHFSEYWNIVPWVGY